MQSTLSIRYFILLIFTGAFLPTQKALSQDTIPIRCALEQWLDIQMTNPEFAQEFRKKEAKYKTGASDRSPSCSNPLILPVAIHWGTDITDVPCLLDMVENQIQVLNEDFGAYNEDITTYCDHAYQCPSTYPYSSISGGTCIQFCLATMNHPPGSGLSNGDPAFTFGQYTFPQAPPWDGYVNIFVSTIPPTGYGANLLGLAPLYGGSDPDGNGVWVNAKAFGGYEEECVSGSVVINSYNNYDLGRTTTHELGHFYGLYHTFQGCGYGDGIADTPSQNEPNYGVPMIGPDCISTAHNTCGTQDFFFNYMDYTDDVAMYMFTSDQSDLMYEVASDGNYQDAATTCGDLPGSYSPTYPNGCFECPTLSVESTTQDATCYGECDASISVDDIVDGEAPFTYNWDNGEETASIEDICAGTYSVTITDTWGCEVTASITVSEPDKLVANASATPETANNSEDGTATADPTGGTEPYYYTWSNGATSQSIDDLAPALYTVTVMDFNGCESVESVLVEEFICPALSINYFQKNVNCFSECNGQIEILGVDNGIPPFDYAWSNGAVTAVNDNLCAGEYWVSITDVFNCPITSDIYTVTQPELLVLETSSNPESYWGGGDGSATATVTGGTTPYTYAWSNGGSTATIMLIPPGEYTVTVTDANDCERIATVVVDAFSCPDNMEILTSIEDAGCQGECSGLIEITDVIGAFGSLTYEWSHGEIGAIVEDLCAGDYKVTISDYFNCSVVDSFEIAEPDELTVIASATDETALDASDGTASADASGGTGPYSYAWSNGAFVDHIYGLSPGEYTVTVTDVNECTTVASVTVGTFTCPELALVSETSNSACYGDCSGTIDLTEIVNGTSPFSYSWSNGESTAQLDNLCAGNYSITVTDHLNCSASGTFTITEPDELSLQVSATAESANEASDGTASCNPAGGTPPYSLAWSSGQITATIENLAPGNYSVTVTDNADCTTMATVTVAPFICPELFVQSEISHNPCFGDCLGSIDATTVVYGEQPLQYTWNNGASTPVLEELCAGNYVLTITDAKNCSLQQNFTIDEPGEMIINIEEIVDVQNGEAGSIDISVNGDFRFEWKGDNGFSSTEEDISVMEAGCYDLVVTDPLTDCTIDTTICIQDLTGTIDWLEGSVRVYPNPAMDQLTIDFYPGKSLDLNISLFDLHGMMVPKLSSLEKDNGVTLDTSMLPDGIYLIKIQMGDQFIYKKLVILHKN